MAIRTAQDEGFDEVFDVEEYDDGFRSPFSGKSGGGSKKGGKNKMPPQKGSAKNRAGADLGRNLCLRCGQAGHFARNCPSKSDKKRKVDENSDATVMMVEEHYDLAAEDEKDDTVNTAVQDGGAASVLGSHRYIRKHMRYLLENHYNVREIDIFRCQKGFRYGNSEKEVTNLCVLLPIHVGAGRSRCSPT